MGDLSIQAIISQMALRPGNGAVPKDPITHRSGVGGVCVWGMNLFIFFRKFYMSSDTPLSDLGCNLISPSLLSLKIGPGVWTTCISKTLDWLG